MSVIRRRRQTDWREVPAEPVRIVEPETQAADESDQDLEGAERSGRAASSRVDYDAVCDKFRASATNRRSAIRAMCVICMGGMVYEVAKCTSTRCPLYAFRMGENPNDARTIAAKKKKEEAEAQAAQAQPATRKRRARG